MPAHPERLLRHLRHLASSPATDPTSDADLLRRFVRVRDEEAFATLVTRHGGLVLGVCRRLLGNATAAEDAFQAVWLVLAQKAATVRPAESLAAWLHGVARQVARNARRAEGRRRRREATLFRAAPSPRLPDPLDELTARELLLVLDEEIERLPQLYRAPVVLVCLEGLSQEEAAVRLGWSAGSVKGRLERGRARLHQRLTKRGLTLSAVLATATAVPSAGAAVAASLLGSIVEAATLLAAGEALPAGIVPVQVLAWVKEVLQTMRMTKLKIVLAVCLVCVACAAALFASLGTAQEPPGPPERKAEPQTAQPGSAAGSPLAVSLIQLIATPKAFDGKYVRVWGFVRFEHEGSAIYLHREDFEQALTKNGLWLVATDIPAEGSDEAKVNNRYALIEGRFNAGERGHRGLWSGSLDRITRMIPWEIRKPK
ncbi:MAG TPA: sigma-70 family RNA polymerase sigma factor [Gemmataceae bacterium]|nr:sigma-70 family RNA polymerase sigma factor [Gemmataceae bacterium]